MLTKIKHKLKGKSYPSSKERLGKICVEIYDQNNKFITRGKMVRKLNKNAFIISNDLEVYYTPNEIVKLTIKEPKQEALFVMGRIASWNVEDCEIVDISLIQHGERRGFFRVKTSGYGHIEMPKDVIPINLVNISLGGSCIMSTQELTLNEEFPICINLDEYTLNAYCQVVRRVGADMYGIRFSHLSENQQSDLYSTILKIQQQIIQQQKFIQSDIRKVLQDMNG